MSGEIWITSDGRAYLVGLQGDTDQEGGKGTDPSHSMVSSLLCSAEFIFSKCSSGRQCGE
jgi:hypothetical protein